MHGLAIFLQAFVAASIFFVWGVRHSNIARGVQTVQAAELQAAELAARFPGDSEDHRRDSASGRNQSSAAIFGGLMIAVLMAAAVVTHFRVKNPPLKMLLSVALSSARSPRPTSTTASTFRCDPHLESGSDERDTRKAGKQARREFEKVTTARFSCFACYRLMDSMTRAAVIAVVDGIR